MPMDNIFINPSFYKLVHACSRAKEKSESEMSRAKVDRTNCASERG